MEIESLTLDPEEQALRDLGRDTDLSEDRPLPQGERDTQPETRAPGKETQTQPETRPTATGEDEIPPVSSEIDTKPEDLAHKKSIKDEKTGQFQKQEQLQPEKGEKAIPDTPATRAQKEQERKDRSWQRLEQEKAEFRREQQLATEQARMAQLQHARAQTPVQKDGLDARGYWEGAQMFQKQGAQLERQGDFENATIAYRSEAAALRTTMELHQQETAKQAQREQAQAEYAWRSDMENVARQNPDLMTPGNPVGQMIEQIIAQNPYLYYIPHGFMRAAEIAHLLVERASMSELQDETEKLRAELEKRAVKSQPLGGGSPRGAGGVTKSFDEMSLDEQEHELEHQTKLADQYR